MKIERFKLTQLFLVISLTLFVACDDPAEEACKEAEQGKIVNYTSKGILSVDYINSLKPSLGLPESFSAQYDVKVYSVDYETTDPNGKTVIASGAVYYPKGLDEPLSLLSGQHGLTIKRSDVASLIPIYGYLGLFGASVGYVGIQPDYLGLGNSTFPYYPVYQKSNGKVLLDMVEGVQAFSCENDIELNDNLFVMGYSNGGYNSIAMHDELSKNPRSFDIDASVVIAGYFDLDRDNSFSIPQRLERPSWAIYHPYVINRTYNLNIIDKIIREPYLSKLDDLFDGEKEALVIDNSLTTYTDQLFTSEYLNEFSTLSVFDSYKNAVKENSLLGTKLSGDILLIHSKEDEIVPYSQSEKFYTSAISSGANAEIVLLEKGKHNIQDYVGAVVDALDWLKKYE